jgi:predicted DNA repair protein MutK
MLLPWPQAVTQRLGRAILWAAPFLMKTLSVAGTVAMFLVGGGIITHGIPWLHHLIQNAAAHSAGFAPVVPLLLDGVCGLIADAIVLLLFNAVQKLRGKTAASHS